MGSGNFYHHQYLESELSYLYQKTSDDLILPLDGAEDLDINFDYFGWEPFLEINEGETEIRPQEFKFKSSLPVIPFHLNFQRFYTTYDFSFPVLVTLNDPEALNGEGYIFSFALEANVVNNRAAKDEFVEPEVVTALSDSMVCNKDKMNTEPIRAVVIDSSNNEPMELVSIGFQIPDQDYCSMGLTDVKGELETNYPAVYGGVMDFTREGYLTSFYPIDTYAYREQPSLIGYAAETWLPAERVIKMHPFKTVSVNVKKKNLEKCLVPLLCEYILSGPVPGGTVGLFPYKEISCELGEQQCFFNQGNNLFSSGTKVASFEAEGSMSKMNDYYFVDSTKELLDDETVIFSLKRIGDNNPNFISDEYSAFFTLKGTDTTEIQLVPGIYEVSATAFLEHEIVIPEDERCFSYTVLTWDKEECNMLDQVTMDKYASGLIKWNTPNTYFEITPEDLYTAKEVTFSILSQNILNVPEKIVTLAKECAGITCVPAVGCLYEDCDSKNIEISGRVPEDLQLLGKMENISQLPEVRAALEPMIS